MASKARAENEALTKRIAELEAQLGGEPAPKRARKPKTADDPS
jgi:BMFP domain-containing protein YqiC